MTRDPCTPRTKSPFQQLQQRAHKLTNQRELFGEERDALSEEVDAVTEKRDALLTETQGLEARNRAIETDLQRDRANIVTLNTRLVVPEDCSPESENSENPLCHVQFKVL